LKTAQKEFGRGMGLFISQRLTCLVNVIALIPGVVVNLRKAGFGGSSQPKKNLRQLILEESKKKVAA